MNVLQVMRMYSDNPAAWNRIARLVAVAGLLVLAGCAIYRPLPLPPAADLTRNPARLEKALPGGRVALLQKVDFARPVSTNRIGLLAVLNDPELKSERGELQLGQSGVLQAMLLPNPSANIDYGALISGPGTTSSLGASLAEDIVAIITRDSRVRSAKAHFAQVEADQLWREWQVAQKARQLAVDIYWGDGAIELTRREQGLLGREIAQVRKAVSTGDLTLAALAPLLSADAAAEQSLVTLRLSRLKNWQALDALLGLDPKVRFSIERPHRKRLPRHVDSLVATLPNRRPDLLALRFGYRSAEQNVRAAILGQFPALAIGGAYGSDTSSVVTAGPTFGFALPVFDRNQGHVAKAQATRALLREQYQARLDKAVGNIRALLAQSTQLSDDLRSARKAATSARSLAATARKAYSEHNLDQRSLTDYERTALQRAIEVVDIERQLGEDRIFLTVELGIDAPYKRIALRRGTEI